MIEIEEKNYGNNFPDFMAYFTKVLIFIAAAIIFAWYSFFELKIDFLGYASLLFLVYILYRLFLDSKAFQASEKEKNKEKEKEKKKIRKEFEKRMKEQKKS